MAPIGSEIAVAAVEVMAKEVFVLAEPNQFVRMLEG